MGWPGRSHDSRVFNNNPLFNTLPARLMHRNARRLIDTYHIVADSAYPCKPEVLTPFKRPQHGQLNNVQRKYNTHLASKRNVSTMIIAIGSPLDVAFKHARSKFSRTCQYILPCLIVLFAFQNVERGFGLLLQRFPRLLILNQYTLEKKIRVVMAACILHNVCILEKDNIGYFLMRADTVSKIENSLLYFLVAKNFQYHRKQN